ncbi:metalloproteinase inhibitor 3-like isoform X3 [Pomacea canaliculata]|uniref:metalloproteinase inhibitor 3-like isoform X3 n=1 Tax=Pomacea canaliculata TaxID=400727 RepID=UPI000D73A032|nr:metalloproteinase inhibitor 3-like isoform X3 [Pomacea canaliculata]
MTRVLVSVVVVLWASVTISDGCSCISEVPLHMYCQKDMIIKGTAVSEFKEGPTTDIADSFVLDQFSDWIYTIQVDQVFWAKQEFANLTTITVKTAVAESLCGIRFALDIPYVFFVYGYDGIFWTGLCDQNTPWDRLDAEDKDYISTVIPDHCTATAAGTQP